MHGEGEEEADIRRSTRTRPPLAQEKESRSRDKSKRKHKESKRHKKESKREHELGELEPTNHEHERCGGSVDAHEGGEMQQSVDAEQNTGEAASYMSCSVRACQSLCVMRVCNCCCVPSPCCILLELPAFDALPEVPGAQPIHHEPPWMLFF